MYTRLIQKVIERTWNAIGILISEKEDSVIHAIIKGIRLVYGESLLDLIEEDILICELLKNIKKYND